MNCPECKLPMLADLTPIALCELVAAQSRNFTARVNENSMCPESGSAPCLRAQVAHRDETIAAARAFLDAFDEYQDRATSGRALSEARNRLARLVRS